MVNVVPQHFRVLCVDDSAVVLEMLPKALSLHGFETDAAHNGFAALAKVRRNPAQYGVIVTDLRTAGMDNFGFIEEARSSGYGGPFIVFAASISPDDRNRARELRVHRVIDKPARPSQLVEAIKELQSGS